MNELMVYAMWDAEAGVWVALRCVARLLGACKERSAYPGMQTCPSKWEGSATDPAHHERHHFFLLYTKLQT